jgi:hypothetical protein
MLFGFEKEFINLKKGRENISFCMAEIDCKLISLQLTTQRV